MDVPQLRRNPPDHPRQPAHVRIRPADKQRPGGVAEVYLRVNNQKLSVHRCPPGVF